MERSKSEIETEIPFVSPKLRLTALKKRKEEVLSRLNQIKNSYTYNVLMTYEDPLTFIEELQVQFRDRIVQLEKRTRTR